MKIHALLVDDEPPARDELAFLLTSFPDIEVAEARNAREALEKIREDTPDLVFLDIQLPGRDGFQVLRESLCLPTPPLFIFVSAFDEYAVRAFEENAVDYLLKPVSLDRLQKSIGRARTQLSLRQGHSPLQPELTRIPGGTGQEPPLCRLTVERGGRIQLIDLSEVIYCERVDKKILVHTRGESSPVMG